MLFHPDILIDSKLCLNKAVLDLGVFLLFVLIKGLFYNLFASSKHAL
jgi:hypothetical protein